MNRVTTLAELAKAIQLVDIRPTGLLARHGLGVVPAYGEKLDVAFTLKVGFARKDDQSFVALLTAVVRARRTPSDRDFARFTYRAYAQYSIPVEASDELLLEFSRTNGMINLWPYLRAWVQTASASLGLIPIVIPVFRVQPTPVGEAESKKGTGE